jgi:hypothetical protein
MADPAITDAPPAHARIGATWAYGRYRAPIPAPDLGVTGLRRWRQKEWHYTAFTTDRWFLGFGLVQLGYVANAFLYVVDRRRPGRPMEHEGMSPLGRALRFAPSSVSGATTWRRGAEEVCVRWDGAGWQVRLDVPLAGERLQGEARMGTGEALALLHPLGPDQPAYTHKGAALPLEGRLVLGREAIELDGGLASIDWTRSIARRETRWKWASFSARLAEGTPFGLNLSADVYDDAAGHSRENAFWHHGRVTPLGGVAFDVPSRPAAEPWRIRSLEGDAVALTFKPLGARAQRLNLGLVRSDFVQPYGHFHGSVAGHRIEGAFGVVEDHLSVW